MCGKLLKPLFFQNSGKISHAALVIVAHDNQMIPLSDQQVHLGVLERSQKVWKHKYSSLRLPKGWPDGAFLSAMAASGASKENTPVKEICLYDF